jgi:hypothetical protein
VVALYEGAGPPIWVNPMLDELVASLVVSRSVGASALGCPSTLTAASMEVQTLVADSRSPPRMVQLSFADAKAPRVDGDRPPTSMSTSPSTLARVFARHVSAPLKTPILKAPPDVELVALRRQSPSVVAHVWWQSVPLGPLTPPFKRRRCLCPSGNPPPHSRRTTR